MPESRNRRKHHQHSHNPIHVHRVSKTPKRSAAVIIAILTAILGLAVTYFTQGADVLLLITGTVAGAIVGFLVGRAMDRSIEKK